MLEKAHPQMAAARTHSGDAATADLFTQITRAIDKQLWLMDAHLQAER
jgi:starvation-inducible DNA-binding protein